MQIIINSGTGVGPTELSAFDNALVNAGVANFNLIYLSSVLPPGCDVVVSDRSVVPKGGWGDKLYVVMAQKRASQRNQEVWAGIGWVQDPETKKGLFVEHEGHSEAEVRADIKNSLEALQANRGTTIGPVNMHVVGKKCVALPVCALVVAVFESSEWENLRPEANTKKSRFLPRAR
ncbi:MAG: pyruvoyl-dependent arginine decarboxylase [Candidatus Saccharibacteria bacterium]|nr:pyruvoyl-dependent arginine decarboxylase [Candidatus Saccharibacteria bacterium]